MRIWELAVGTNIMPAITIARLAAMILRCLMDILLG